MDQMEDLSPRKVPEHPMHIHSPPLRLFLESTVGPILIAIALRVADSILPDHAKKALTLCTFVYHVYAFKSSNLIWRPILATSLGAVLFWIFFFALTRWICFACVSARRLLVATFALEIVLPVLLLAFWEHVQADSSAEQQSYRLTLTGNFANVYTIFSLLLVWPVITLWTLRVLGLLACYILGLLLLGKLTKWHAYWAGFGYYLHILITAYNELLTMYSVFEAIAVEQLPLSVQRWYSRLAQRRRRTRNVKQYGYRPLAEGNIRLLVVKRSSVMLPSVIEANLVHVSLRDILEGDTACQFEAISYRWGSAERVDSILVDGAEFRVTQSAFDVILARRSLFQERTMWIDAICINQSDQEEKQRQIQMMQDIYSSAWRVIVVPGIGWQIRLAANTLTELRIVSQVPWMDVDNFGLKFRARRSAVVGLLNNEYFLRSWIVQEVALGKEVELYVGGVYMAWHQYWGIATFLFAPERRYRLMQTDSPSRANRYNGMGITSVSVISFMRYRLQSCTGETLETVMLATASYLNATDPRDKVFSILGLAPDDRQHELLRPSYSKSAEEVFENLAEYLFLRGPQPSIQLLALAGVGYPQLRLALPSWVPDLSQKRLNDPFTRPLGFGNQFRASGDTVPCVGTANSNKHTLVLNGILCDKINGLNDAGPLDFVGGKPTGSYEMKASSKTRLTFIKGAMHTIQRHGHLFAAGPQEPLGNLWRVLIADQVGREGHPDLQSKNFYHWLRYLEVQSNTDDVYEANKAIIESAWGEEHVKFSLDGSLTAYSFAVAQKCLTRSFAITESGRMCLVPPLTQLGDTIFVPFGAQVPYLIREAACSGSHKVYTLIGEAYVHGIMNGELLDAPFGETVVQIQ